MSDESKKEEEKHCVFCGKPIIGLSNAMVQCVFDGWRELPDGKVAKKRPGAAIFWHDVCEMPEEDDGS